MRHHRLSPKLLRFRATPSIPTSKKSSSCSFKEKEQAGLQGLQGPPGQGPPGPLAASTTPLQARAVSGFKGVSRGLQGASRGVQGPPGASNQGASTSSDRTFCASLSGPDLGVPSADLLQLGARTPPGGPPRRSLKMWVCQVGFRVFPSKGKSMYIVYRAVPPDVREEPGGALYVHSP